MKIVFCSDRGGRSGQWPCLPGVYAIGGGVAEFLSSQKFPGDRQNSAFLTPRVSVSGDIPHVSNFRCQSTGRFLQQTAFLPEDSGPVNFLKSGFSSYGDFNLKFFISQVETGLHEKEQAAWREQGE